MNGDNGRRYDPIPLQSDYIASWLTGQSSSACLEAVHELGETGESINHHPPAPVSEDVLPHSGLRRHVALRKRTYGASALSERSAALAEEQIKSVRAAGAGEAR